MVPNVSLRNVRRPPLRASYAASSWLLRSVFLSSTLTVYSTSSSSTVSLLASGMCTVPFTGLTSSPSPSNVHSHASVTSKSNPCLGLPRTITTVASPLNVLTSLTTAEPPPAASIVLPTTSSSTRALAQSVWPRSSQVPARFQELRPTPPPLICFASLSASSSLSFTGAALGAVPWLACWCQ